MAQADINGVVHGRFRVPPNIPAGTKSVVFRSATGAVAETTYTGSGTITTLDLRRVTNITKRRYDPLAQTFTLSESRLLAGVDLWFTQKGVHDVRVQIRETATGIPNQTILSECIKKTDEILLEDQVTEFRFNPIFAAAGVEYAIVVLTDDPNYKVRIAEIGKFDSERGYLTSQPFQIGVLLSSSNAVTWTPHQKMDLTFRLLAARFPTTRRVVNCGTVTTENASDLMPLASVERTSSETDLRFVITDTSTNRTYEVLDDQSLNLDHRISGELQVDAHLTGSEKFSPILYPAAQLSQGKLVEEADYITRAIPCGENSNLKVCFEAQLGIGAGVDVFRETEAEWVQMTQTDGEGVGDNWVERTYLEAINEETVRIKLLLRGNAANRPRVRSLRVITT